MADAFRWSAVRKVTATVSLAGNRYTVDPALVGRRVELRYDPEDLTRLDVLIDGRPAGVATPFVLGRHVHPAVPQAERAPAPATGVDYLGMVQAAHEKLTSAPIAFRDLADPGDQLELFDTEAHTGEAS